MAFPRPISCSAVGLLFHAVLEYDMQLACMVHNTAGKPHGFICQPRVVALGKKDITQALHVGLERQTPGRAIYMEPSERVAALIPLEP